MLVEWSKFVHALPLKYNLQLGPHHGIYGPGSVPSPGTKRDMRLVGTIRLSSLGITY